MRYSGGRCVSPEAQVAGELLKPSRIVWAADRTVERGGLKVSEWRYSKKLKEHLFGTQSMLFAIETVMMIINALLSLRFVRDHLTEI